MKKPILLIAEAANPEWVSVPLLGWSHAEALARLHEVHLVTQVRNRDAILNAGSAARAVHFINSEAVAKFTYKIGQALRGGAGKGWTTLMAAAAPAYYYFERLVWRELGADIRAGRFALVHRLTPLSPTMPSVLAQHCANARVPFVLGPLNGGVPWPSAFDQERRKEREWLSYVRSAYKLLPGYTQTRRCASAIVCGSRHTMSEMPAWAQPRCIYVPENGIDPDRFTKRRARHARLPLQLIFVGRLVPYKGADMLLEAAAPILKDGRAQLSIIGDGPERARLERMVSQLGLQDAVRFEGWLPHTKVQDHLANSDLLVFPSIREFGGGVILEAMAIGVPSMAVDYAGPSELMNSQTAFPIPLAPRSELIEGFRAALLSVCEKPEQLDEKGAKGLTRIEARFTWARKAEQLTEVFRWVTKERPDKPEFDFL